MQSLSELSNEENSQEEYEVEKILKERRKLGKDKKTGRFKSIREYLVKWVGYEDPTWEPEENLENCQEILKDFLLSQIIKTLQSEKRAKSNSNDKVKKKSDNDNDKEKNSDEEKDNETSTFSNSIPRSVKNINTNNNDKKFENSEDEKKDVIINIDKEKADDKKEPKENNKRNKENIMDEKNMNKSNDELGFKIKSINSMVVPKDKNEGIMLNIKYEKDGKAFVDNFNAKIEEIPNKYLIKYYEKFICDNYNGVQYDDEMKL